MADVGYADIASPARADAGDQGEQQQTIAYWSLEKCKRAYLEYLGSKQDEIDEQQHARQYRHGAQWTTHQVEILNMRKQPVVTYNRIGRKIDSIVGLMERLKLDPKGFPRNPRMTDEASAELATSVVRYVVDTQLREVKFPFAIEQGAIDGIGGVEMLLVKGDKGDPDIGFELVIGDSFFYDPRSYLHDFSDARYMGQAKWTDLDDAKAMFPASADKLEAATLTGGGLTTNSDRERRWFDSDQTYKRIRLVEIWYKHTGGWCWAIFTGFDKLAEGRGYFYDELGREICKYIMFSSFIDHDGDRYGFVRNLRSSQDEINQRRSKGLHELVSRRIKAEEGAFADIETARREAVRPDGVIIYNKGFQMEFDDQTRVANVEGHLKFLEDAKNEIENFGPNPALIGQGLEYKSGRAINLLQQAGIAELGPFVINIKNWKLRLYRAIWAAVQQYWKAERWIRVTSDEQLARAVVINGLGIDPLTHIPRLVNSLGSIDVNFILEEGPDEVNMMADSYDTLIALTAQGAKIPPQILIELAPLPGTVKRKLQTILSQPDPVAQATQQVAIQSEAAKIDETKSRTALNVSKAQQTSASSRTGVIERVMDAQMAAQQHQNKMAEGAAKIGAEQLKARAKLSQDFANLRTKQVQGAQQIQQTAVQGALKMGQMEQQHQQRMRHADEMNKARVSAQGEPQ